MKFNWNYPTTVWVGKNRINDLYIACENLKIAKPLLKNKIERDLKILQIDRGQVQVISKQK